MNRRTSLLIAAVFLLVTTLVYFFTMAPTTSNGGPSGETHLGTCTLSIQCSALSEDLTLLPKEKRYLVPKGGVILAPTELAIYEGDTVFDLTLRTAKALNLHLEFTESTVYSSAYIEGLANLYEFDAGELSGWTLRVNGTYPSFGCDAISVQNGDVVEWIYATERYGEGA